MNLNNYELSCIILIITLIHFITDYLSDGQIENNETKIGILIFIHHLLCIITFYGSILCLLFSRSIFMAFIIIVISIVIQSGYLINKDYCWYTIMVNKMINHEQPKRKWRGDLFSLIKHYIRGDSWAYSDIRNANQDNVLYLNILLIIYLIKLKFIK